MKKIGTHLFQYGRGECRTKRRKPIGTGGGRVHRLSVATVAIRGKAIVCLREGLQMAVSGSLPANPSVADGGWGAYDRKTGRCLFYSEGARRPEWFFEMRRPPVFISRRTVIIGCPPKS